MTYRYVLIRFLLPAVWLLAGCAGAARTPTPVPTEPKTPPAAPSATQTALPSATATRTQTPRPSLTPTVTRTPTITLTATATPTATITPTATRDYPRVTVKKQANCRYGPGTAYLYRWGLYPGDNATVHGRNWNGSWWWILPDNLPESHCWASEIVFEETVTPDKVPLVTVPLPHTTFAGPPGNVKAERQGNQVTVWWDDVPLSEDKRRGYLLELMVCQDGAFFPLNVQTDAAEYTVKDEKNCAGESGGLLYTAEKHGYSDPVRIPWPK